MMMTQAKKLIPVNVKAGEIIDPIEKFDSQKRESHLKTCPERQKDWDQLRERYEMNPDLTITIHKEESALAIQKPDLRKKQVRELSAEEKAEHERRFKEILAEEIKTKAERASNG